MMKRAFTAFSVALLLSLGTFAWQSPSERAAAAAVCDPVDAFGHWLVSAANAGGSNDAGDNFGAATVVADFNGDGFADVAAGAPQDAVGGVRSGAVSVFPGSAGGLGTTGLRLTQSNVGGANEAGDGFGAALAAADFNRDGYADLVVGAPGEAVGTAAGSGAINVFLGSATGLGSGVGRDQSHSGGGNEAGDHFGQSLAAGDLDGDGFPDLAVGTPGEAPGSDPAGGVVFVFRGSATGLVGNSFRTQEGAAGNTEAGDRFGAAVAIGDVSGDGIADLAVGAPGEAPNADPAGGAVYVLPSSGAGYYRTQANGGGGSEAGDNFGAALAIADFNGNGIGELAVGTPGEAPGSEPAGGIVYILSASSGYFLTQAAGGGTTEAGDGFGAVLAAADFDRDGFADLAAGAAGDRLGSGPASGAVLLFGGGPRNLERARRIAESEVGSANEGGDRFGGELGAGDVTGDGRPELAVGTPGEAIPGEPAGGVITVVSGLSGAISLGPIVGGVDGTSARFWARGARPGQLRVQYRQSGTAAWTTAAATAAFDATRDHTAVVTVTGLNPATAYEYRLGVDCVADALSGGVLRTSPAANGRVRFAYGADINGAPFTGLSNVVGKDPDFMVFGGDNLYADVAPAATVTAEYYAKYRNQFGEAHFRRLTARVPSLMMWDDHEIVNDWSGGQTGRYLQARPAYDAYQGSHNPANGPHFTFRSGPVDMFVLDTRSFRSPNNAVDNASKTMLGAAQKAALKAWLSASTSQFKFLVSSVPFSDFGTTNNDSWRGFTTERAEIFRYIRDNRIGGVVLLSGDQHWSAVFRNTSFAPYRFYEFMPTPLWTNNRPPPAVTDPQILFINGDRRIYAVFDVDATVSPARLTVEYFDAVTNASVHRLSLTPNDIQA